MLPSEIIEAQSLQRVRITEIMYDPNGNGDREFLEFYNGSDTAVNMSGWSVFGVDYTFPSGTVLSPGEYFVIGRNIAVLKATFPSARIIGQYGEKLQGEGELIRLSSLDGVVSQVHYSNGGAWPTSPRDKGPSLSLIRVDADESVPACWAPSASFGGTPSRANDIDTSWSASRSSSCPTKPYAKSSGSSGGSGGGSSASGSTGSSSSNNNTQTQEKKAEENKKKQAKREKQRKKAQREKESQLEAEAAAKVAKRREAEAAQKRENASRNFMLAGGLLGTSAIGAGSVFLRNHIQHARHFKSLANAAKKSKKVKK